MLKNWISIFEATLTRYTISKRHTCTHVTRVHTVTGFFEIQLQIPFRLVAKCESDLTDKLKLDNFIFFCDGRWDTF